MTDTAPQYLRRKNKPSLAYIYSAGSDEKAPLTVFCGGYRSDMTGTKATFFERSCRARESAYLRFDYSGHGESNGRFEDGLIGYWIEDAADIIDFVAQKRKIILIGSSMGGWISLILARRWPDRIKALIGIAAAPDFTQDIYDHQLTPAQRTQLETRGFLRIPNDYSDEPYHFTRAFFQDGATHNVLDRPLPLNCPVRLFQGGLDTDVPPETAQRIKDCIRGPDTQVVVIEDGDHRLSRPQDLALMDREIAALSGS